MSAGTMASAPDVFVSCAHELIAKPGEYERTAAAAINCYIGPSTSRYVQRLDNAVSVLVERFWELPEPDPDRLVLESLPVRSRDFH